MYVAGAINERLGYLCSMAAVEGYPRGKNFLKYFFRSDLKDKIKTASQAVRSLYLAKKNGKGILRKIPKVYFISMEASSRLFRMIPKKVLEDIDIFLLACDDSTPKFAHKGYDQKYEHKTSDYVSALLWRGIAREKIFIVPPEMYYAELPVIEDGKLSPLCRNINSVKPILRYLECHITDFCNLKCKGCNHLSNYVRKLDFADIDGFRLSLSRLAEKFSDISDLRLLGGEPLLCKNLHEYINIAHEIFPYSGVKIVTNGLLVKNMTRSTIDAIRATGAEIIVTQYPPTRKVAGEIIAFCRENGIKLRISTLKGAFFMTVSSGNNFGSEERWNACKFDRYCHFLRGTEFYPCPMIWTYGEPQFRDAVKERAIDESELREYSYDLTQDIPDDGWDILAKFENPMKPCRKCGDKIIHFKWESEIPEYNK